MISSDSSDCRIATLPNGVRVVVLPRPHLASACVSVYVRGGSASEPRALNGISHVIEHMVFKGTATRDARRINVDAERLGAEVDAYTDKDHTAYHLRGLAGHATEFVRLLADIVRHPTFPPEEVERERQVLLHEYADDEDDPTSTAFKLFDQACFGSHPLAWPVIGHRRTLERFRREDLAAFVAARHTAANLVVGAAGHVDPDAIVGAVEAAFGSMPPGTETRLEPPAYLGGLKARRLYGSGQMQLVIGWPIPPRRDGDTASLLAATLFGEGMSSPLMHRLREERALAYYAACSADLLDACGQFVVEASTSTAHADEVVGEVLALLHAQAERTDRHDLERARRQLAVRIVRGGERPARELEDAVLDLLSLGRVRSAEERLAAVEAMGTREMQRLFQRLLAVPPAVALAGPVTRRVVERARERLQAFARSPA